MVSNDLYPLTCVPSRISSHSSTLIDNVFVGHLSQSCSEAIMDPGSDHLPVTANVMCLRNRRIQSKKIVTFEVKTQHLNNIAM